MNVLAACGGPDSPVRKVIFKSSAHYYGCEQDDPAFFTEAMRRPHPPRTPIERDIVEAESAVRDFATRNHDDHRHGPALRQRPRARRCARRTCATSALPVIPTILGFDPRYGFIHEDDMAACLEHAVRYDLDGVFNCAADGVLVLSEVVSLLGKQLAPVLPPWGTSLALGPARRLGLHDLRPRCATCCASAARWTTAASRRPASATATRRARRCSSCAATSVCTRSCARTGERYRYESAVEEFLRFSPSVRAGNAAPARDARQLAELRKASTAAGRRARR